METNNKKTLIEDFETETTENVESYGLTYDEKKAIAWDFINSDYYCI